uniref:Uncharacterized protein n=1 Tax=Rangifer tarandus platyrhynchus TaxID=3082113 RepID=A0ACB0EK73_RANTA|nr:unnamed protein product [Rangifer tarandus platyrhynchus]
MEDRYRVQSAGKESWGVGAGASGVRPKSSLPGRRVYVCVHGGEVQGVCTARAGRAPVRPPSSAAIQGQRRRVKIPRKTLTREPLGAG